MPGIGGLATGELGGLGGGTGGGGGGAVNSVTATDASIVVSGTASNPTIATGTLDQIANLHTAVANWTNGGFKITNVANGTVATDVAAFGQIPTVFVVSVAAADTSIVIGGTASNPTVRTNTLDVVATQHPPAADWSNNSHKITNLANGTAATDAAAFGQIPTILPTFTVTAVSATGNSTNLTLELVTTAASTITRTLPAPTANATIAYKKVDSGAGTVVISHHAAETIDGLTTQTIVNQWSSLTLCSDGTNWFVI